MMWGWREWCGDDRATWGQRGQHVETTDHGDHMGTFFGLWGWRGRWGQCGDDVGTMGTTWGWHGDNGDDVGTMGKTCGDHRPWRPHGDLLGAMGTMGTTWGRCGMTGMKWGWCGDNRDSVGMTGTMRGQQGPCGDNKITKNAITFEWIEIIEFCLKIWDPWSLPHTCRLQLMCRWGVSYPKLYFYPKSAPVTLEKFFFLFLHWIPLDHI